MAHEEHFCNCCGAPIQPEEGSQFDPEWCRRCAVEHIESSEGPTWRRTYFARTGKPCPYQE